MMDAWLNRTHHGDCLELMADMPEGWFDLILTDPPYTISRKTHFHNSKNEKVWKFAQSINTEFGDWDKVEIDLDRLAELSYARLRKGGTIIVFYDLWKITTLANALTQAGFKQLRFIEWLKPNPVPVNSKLNYLTNSREIAVTAVKGGKPTFNSEYDCGVYDFIGPEKANRIHPTQKPLHLFMSLLEVHSNRHDLVLDPFMGSGTTAVAATNMGRQFVGVEKDAKYCEMAKERYMNAVSQMSIDYG